MAARLKKLARLFALYARMDAQWFAQDTALCLVCVLSETLSSIASVTAVFLLAVRFGGVGSMNQDEVLFMLGFYTLSTGLYNLFFNGNNTGEISRRIGRGQLDHCLIQPLPLWVQLLTEGFLPISGCQGALCGAIITAVAAGRLRLAVTLPSLLLFLLFLLASVGVQVGMRYVASLSAFTHPVGSEEISSVMGNFLTSIGYYPLGGLPHWAQGLLVTVLPAGCLSWLPSMLLLGKSPFSGAIALYPLVAVLVCGAGALSFKKGLKVYEKYGSQRYKAMGHRS